MKFFLIHICLVLALSSCYSIKKEIEAGKNGDVVAKNIMKATGQDYWPNQKIIKWKFQKKEHIWDRARKYHYVKYKNTEVWMSLDSIDGIVKIDDEIINGESKSKELQKAYQYWANDSFWLNPFAKFYDPRTQRKLIKLKDGSEALAIYYTKNDSTLGDVYVWTYDAHYLPTSWKLWVKIIPIKGYKMSWENWVEVKNIQFGQLHKSPLFTIKLSNINCSKTIDELFNEDPFEVLR